MRKNGATASGSPSAARIEANPPSICAAACGTDIRLKVKGWVWLWFAMVCPSSWTRRTMAG